MKVLHVTECMNAGVAYAIFELTKTYSADQHYLLWDSHKDAPTDELRILREFKLDASRWEGGWVRKFLTYHQLLGILKPDVIHVHSSKAGVVTRLLRRGYPLFYSPHCFAFERADISFIYRLFILIAENLLSLNTTAFSVNWPVEYESAKRMFIKKPIFFVPLIELNGSLEDTNSWPIKNEFISIGRIRPQKDPVFFSRIAAAIPDAKFLWIGGPGFEFSTSLGDAGVEILNWMPGEELREKIKESLATVITSGWESGPLTLYESLNQGTPVVVRSAKYSRLLGIDCGENSFDLTSECLKILQSSTYREELLGMQIQKISEQFKKYELLGNYASYHDAVAALHKKRSL